MKRSTLTLLICLLMSLALTAAASSHPPSFGSTPADYAGTWIVDGYDYVDGQGYLGLSEGDDPYVIELHPDGTATLTTEKGSQQGTFEVFNDETGENNMEDMIVIDLPPKGDSPNDLLFINAHGALRQSGSHEAFVRPGLTAPEDPGVTEGFSEKLEGAWLFEVMHIVTFDPPMSFTMTPADILAGTGEKELILSFKGGRINFVSTALQMSFPGLPVKWVGRALHCHSPEINKTGVFYFVGRNKMYMKLLPAEAEADVRMDFTRITGK